MNYKYMLQIQHQNMSTTSFSQTHTDGYLEIILGSMYAGKTSRLIEIYKQYLFCNLKVLVINHSIDTRYNTNNLDENNILLSTHDQMKIPCIQIDILQTQQQYIIDNNIEIILINEGQFFKDLYDFINWGLSYNLKIYVCGLDGDFERNKFGQILDIIPLCDKVYKLTSLCAICKNGTPGIFSKRITNELEQTVIGSDNYLPVCRKCYHT